MFHKNDDTITTEEIQHDEKVLGGIGTILFKYMTRYSNRIGQIDAFTGETDTFGSLLQKCIRTSIVLQKKGIKQGDVVTYYSGVHRNALIPIVSCFLIGAIPSFLDVLLTVQETSHLLKLASPKLLITDPEYLQNIKDIVTAANINTNVFEFSPNIVEYQEEEQGFKPIYIDDLSQLAVIYFSSGSTGLSKGICLNHYRFLAREVLKDDRLWKKGLEMILYSNDSLYWTIEMVRLVSSVRQGVCRLINSGKFDPKETWNVLEKYKVNVAYLIPFELIQMCTVGKPDEVQLSSLTTVYYEGAPLPQQYELELQKILGPNADIFPTYGQTEVGLLLTFSKSDLHREYSKIKVECSGTPVLGSGISYKVVDLDSGKNLGPNSQGELRVKGKAVMLGYYNQNCSDRFDDDGWLRTGDLSYYDEDYCFYISGRIKDLILYQGWHITPASLEAQLLTHPAVLKAVVIGVPYHLDGERPLGLVVVDNKVNSSAEEIEGYMKITGPNRPITVKIVKEIMSTVTGKVKRGELKRMVLSGEI